MLRKSNGWHKYILYIGGMDIILNKGKKNIVQINYSRIPEYDKGLSHATKFQCNLFLKNHTIFSLPYYTVYFRIEEETLKSRMSLSCA